ncbi:hypothetical protein TNCV_3119751 [Trichonephila clavipes]|uniref:Secreted protein n=1 Tax=Trichonephila clavipes TaxID=2585209 RepID=A0A8X6W9L1_TRICX|nr:hypothetical protein TNCV_3119751 [Trichonephila clavipes]
MIGGSISRPRKFMSQGTGYLSLSLAVALSTMWSATAELDNRHSSCIAVSSSIRVPGGGKREDNHGREHPKDFQWD